MRRTNQRLPMPFATLWTALVLTASILGAQARMYSQDRNQGRSMVISQARIVAGGIASRLSSQPCKYSSASGDAVDAAVAAQCHDGSRRADVQRHRRADRFAIVYDAKSGKLYGLNASGWAPSTATTIDFLKRQGLSIDAYKRHLQRRRARRRRWLAETSWTALAKEDVGRSRACRKGR